MARIPSVITSRGEEVRKLSEERRNKWISAISSEDLTDNILNHGRVCGKHFIPGKTAELWSRYDPDWFPTQHLGHQSCGSVEKLCQLKHVARERERQLGEEIESKKQKLYEPGENVIENCFDVESAVGTMPINTRLCLAFAEVKISFPFPLASSFRCECRTSANTTNLFAMIT